MTFEHDGERISYSYLARKNREQLALKRRNIEFWSEQRSGRWDATGIRRRARRRTAGLGLFDRKD